MCVKPCCACVVLVVVAEWVVVVVGVDLLVGAVRVGSAGCAGVVPHVVGVFLYVVLADGVVGCLSGVTVGV